MLYESWNGGATYRRGYADDGGLSNAVVRRKGEFKESALTITCSSGKQIFVSKESSRQHNNYGNHTLIPVHVCAILYSVCIVGVCVGGGGPE